jgi:hypothetical protein
MLKNYLIQNILNFLYALLCVNKKKKFLIVIRSIVRYYIIFLEININFGKKMRHISPYANLLQRQVIYKNTFKIARMFITIILEIAHFIFFPS